MTVVTNKNEITRLVGYGSSGLVDGEDDLVDLERLRNQQHQQRQQWEDDDQKQQLKSFKSKAARIGLSLIVVASVVVMVTTAYSTGYNNGTAATTATATNRHNQEGMMVLDELVMTTTGSGSDSGSSSGSDKGSDQNLHVSFDNTDAIVVPIRRKEREGRGCMFCHLNTAPPVVKEDLVEMMVFNDDNSDDVPPNSVEVTPMTFTYNYELHNGQLLFTDPRSELIPNLQFDYAVLGMMKVRNINRETLENVSLDEVYVHHLTFMPVGMLGAEVLTADPHVYPKGYGYHVITKENPNIVINAHLLSNKDLKPINGSLPLARKLCNECYYAPGKGSDCTPEVSGTFKCCGDSESCTSDEESCLCATNSEYNKHETTKYQIQVDMLITRDIDKIKRVDSWALAAPECRVNLKGEAVFETYKPDSFCYNNTLSTFTGDNSLFHHIELQEDNENPYVKTMVSSVAPSSGLIVLANSHMHTGGVNATLMINGIPLCSTGTIYGTDSNTKTNARNEQNHLIHIESCHHADFYKKGGHRFKAGDIFTMESFYHGGNNDARFIGDGAAGEHKNVMSFFTTNVVFDGDAPYMSKKRTSFNAFGNIIHTLGL